MTLWVKGFWVATFLLLCTIHFLSVIISIPISFLSSFKCLYLYLVVKGKENRTIFLKKIKEIMFFLKKIISLIFFCYIKIK